MYKKILVPVDGSTASERGLTEAISLAKTLNASLRLIHVVNEVVLNAAYEAVPYDPALVESLRQAGARALKEAQSAAIAQGIKAEIELIEVIGGRAADQILEQARSSGVDLIAMGTHGRRGVRRLVMGSDAELVLRGSPVPVLLVRASDES